MTCTLAHERTDLIIQGLPKGQGGIGRHKCVSCVYEQGLQNGKDKVLNFDLGNFILNLSNSQKGPRRHKNALEAYSLGFIHGLNGINKHAAIQEKSAIAGQMREFGLHMVAKGVVNAIFSEYGSPYSHAMSIVHVAHGFEILMKSAIVEEHPLLIFKKLLTAKTVETLTFESLIEHGQTIMYSELPERLWATTGYKMTDAEKLLFNNFGKLRNQIIHFSAPNEKELGDRTLDFVFNLIEKSIYEWWGVTILEYIQEYDDASIEYVFERLDDLHIDSKYEYTEDFELKLK